MEVRLSHTDPAEVGLDAKRLAEAEELLVSGLEAGEYTAAVYLVARHGKVAASGALGRLGREGTPPAAIDSIFDVASITKPVATASSLLALVERGEIQLDQPVRDFFPERRLPHLSGVTVSHLAAHTSGLPAWRDLYSAAHSHEETIEQLFQTPLETLPGEKHVYSCLGYIMLGLVIERASGMSLAESAAETVFEPLGMADTGFNPPQEKSHRIARTANCTYRKGVLIGEVHDANAFAMGGISGNAGLFSTAPDLAAFAQTMLNGGEFEGTRILGARSVEMMLANQIAPSVGGQAYGFFVRPNGMLWYGDSFSNRVAGHTGYTGTSLLLDPEYDMFVILLTNRVCQSAAAEDAPDFLNRRRLFYEIIAAAVR